MSPSARNMLASLAGDVGLPIGTYVVAGLCGFSPYVALLAGTVVAAWRMAWVGIRDLRFDVFAMFLLVLFGVGFLLSFVTGDVRFLLAKDATTSATAGLVFLLSCVVKRPLAYHAAKRFAGDGGREEFLATADTPRMRRRWYTVSLVWGVGLLADATLRMAAAYLLTPNTAANVAQVLTVLSYGLLIWWTIHTGRTNARPPAAQSNRPAVRRRGRTVGATVAVVVVVVASVGIVHPLSAGRAVAQTISGPPFEPETIQRIDLPRGITEASSPVFTDDGNHLLFFAGLQLWIVGGDGTGPACLSCGLANAPTLSPSEQQGFATPFPDGRRVFFGAADSVAVLECAPSLTACEHRHILPVDLSGARPGYPNVPAGGVDARPGLDLGGGVAPKLAPDGTHIAFSDIRSDVAELMVMATLTRSTDKYVTGDPRVLNPPAPRSPTDPNTVAWSNSSGLFEFKSFARGGADATYAQVGGPGLGNPDVWQLNLATGQRTRLTSYPDWDEDNAPSPDGRSMVLESDRGMHRVDSLGALMPVRDFIDDPESAILAGYLVGAGGDSPDIAALRQCDLQPWLLPATGDDGGNLMGQPLLPYTGGDVHAANNISGYPQWSPDGTKIALNTQSYRTNRSAPYILIAHLTSRTPSPPGAVVSSQPGAWAPAPRNYHAPLGGINHIVLHGLHSGTATIDYDNRGGLFAGTDSVTYNRYSDDGRDFVDGTFSIIDPNLMTGPIKVDADLTMTGADTGATHIHTNFSGLRNTPAVTVSGTASSTYDGTTRAGIPVAPQPCPASLPRRPQTAVTARIVGSAEHPEAIVTVTATVPDAGPDEAHLDTRPVVNATVSLGHVEARTNADGQAKLSIPPGTHGEVTIRATAGDTLAPSETKVNVASDRTGN